MLKPLTKIDIGVIDVSSFSDKVKLLTDSDWLEWSERKVIQSQKDSDTIMILNLPDEKFYVFSSKISNDKYNTLFRKELDACYTALSDFYDGGDPKRVMLVRLPAGMSIDPHTDEGYHLETTHRVHLPIITNQDVKFIVGGEVIEMNIGVLTEINNNREHSVENKSNLDRVHLIIDWGKENDSYYTKD